MLLGSCKRNSRLKGPLVKDAEKNGNYTVEYDRKRLRLIVNFGGRE